MRRHRDSRSRIQHANARTVGYQAVVVNGVEPQVAPVPPPPITTDGFESGEPKDVGPDEGAPSQADLLAYVQANFPADYRVMIPRQGDGPDCVMVCNSKGTLCWACCPVLKSPGDPPGPAIACTPVTILQPDTGAPAGAGAIATSTRLVTAPRAIPFAARGPALRAPGDPVVIDVRTAEEFRGGHLPTALSIPVDDLEARIQEVAEAAEGDWDVPVHVYCKKGIRSKKAAAYLTELGFTNVTDLGGLEGSLGGVRRPQVLNGGVW